MDPPQNVTDEFPHFPVVQNHTELLAAIEAAAESLGE
jgi:hypothetical protein